MAKPKTRRGAGRPPTPVEDKMLLRNCRVLPGTDMAIREIAEAEAITQGTAIRRLLEIGVTVYRQAKNGSRNTKYAASASS